MSNIYLAGGRLGHRGCSRRYQADETTVGTRMEELRLYEVCRGDTGHRETKVTYNPETIITEKLTQAAFSFMVIDPTVQNRQGSDIGTQYQTECMKMSRLILEKVSS